MDENEKNLDTIGILVADQVKVKKVLKLRIRMIINLSGSNMKRFGLIHFGQLSHESLVTPRPENRVYKAMGYTDANWLKIEDGNFLSFFLLKDVGNIPMTNNQKYIDGDILTFLKQNVLDYLVIR